MTQATTKPRAAAKRPAAGSSTKAKAVSRAATAAPRRAAAPKKTGTPAAAAKAAGKQQKAAAKEKARKPKLVRDSFTMPEAEYQVLGLVKKACLKQGFEVKKSELLRVGVALLQQLDLDGLRKVLASLPPLKAGRPRKEK